MDRSHWDTYLALMQREMVPALGCTEPVAVALACAKARSLLPKEDGTPTRVHLAASRNILKNAMAVIIPGTRFYGADYACALGALGGNADLGLEVLSTLTEQDAERAEELVESGRIEISTANRSDPIYIEATVYGKEHRARTVICGTHANICLLERDGYAVFQKELPKPQSEQPMEEGLSLRDIFDFAKNVPLERLGIVEESIRLNTAISKDGLENEYGLRTGIVMKKHLEENGGGTIAERAIMRTLAAIDARMDGSSLAVMSNSGSGNQGITATLPVWSVAKDLGADAETTLRAVAFSHLTTIYIKEHLERLSSLCGAIVAAIGASCASAWLQGGDYDAIERTLINILASVTGLICDGAKAGCALKVAASLAAGFQCESLARAGIRAAGIEGIVDSDAERSIDNLAQLTQEGMRETDKAIWSIMLNKNA